MHNKDFESIIRQKLQGLEMAVNPSDWEKLLARLHTAFDELIREKLAELELIPEEGDWKSMLESLNQAVDLAIQSKLAELQLDPLGGDWGHMATQIEGEPFDTFIAAKLGHAELDDLELDWDQFAAKLDEHPIDTTVRQALENEKLPYEPADWTLMMATMETAFDEVIRQALIDHRVSLNAGDWPLMATHLDDSPFDGLIRESLNTYQISYQASDWPIMLSELEAPFDQQLHTKLAEHSVPYLVGDWKLFAARLDETVMPEEKAPPVIWYANWRNYSSAAAAVLLLIFAMLGGRDSVRFRSNPDQLVVLENNSPVILPRYTSSLEVGELVLNADVADTDKDNPESGNQNAIALSDTGSALLPEDASASTAISVAAIQPISGNSSPIQKQISSQLNPDNIAHNLLQEDGKIPHESDPGSIDVLYDQMDLSNIRRVGPVAFGNVLENRNLFTAKAPDSEFSQLEWIPAIRLGLYGANARTWAELTGNEPLSGYSYGLRVEMQMADRLRLVSGIQYSEKRFHYTYPVLLANRRFVENILDGQLFLIEAPLMLRYDFAQHEKTQSRFYLQAGVLAQLSTQENYWHYDPANAANLSSDNGIQLRSLSPEKLERGYNTYTGNLQAALGVEYPITDRISAQLEPYLILGLQPTKGGAAGLNKRLSTVGVGFGLIYDLKKNKVRIP